MIDMAIIIAFGLICFTVGYIIGKIFAVADSVTNTGKGKNDHPHRKFSSRS